MKNIVFKSIRVIVLITLILCYSCTEETNLVIDSSNSVEPEILTPTDTPNLILQIEDEAETAFEITWKKSDYQYAVEITYIIEMAIAGTNFENPVVAGQTTKTSFSWTVDQLNTSVISAGATAFKENELELRVYSVIGTEQSLPLISSKLPLIITPYKAPLPSLAVPGNHQGWSPATAPLIAASDIGESDYEGYVWLDGEFKMIAPNEQGVYAWGNVDYGDDGTFTGKLVADNESNATAETGYYFVKADTKKLTYSVTKYNWAITGNAISTDGGLYQNMIYNMETGVWEITLDLLAGEFKFSANNASDWSYGDNESDGVLENNGANISVLEDGNYTVELDLNTPRYYTYSVVKN